MDQGRCSNGMPVHLAGTAMLPCSETCEIFATLGVFFNRVTVQH